MIGQNDIRAAYARIKPHVRRTPVIRIDAGDFGVTLAHPLTFKLEFLQHAGSFKPRGAFNKLLSRAVPAAGVAAASGGNHGAAVAYAANRLGIKARIFVPEISAPAKIAVIRAHGAEVTIGGARYDDAQRACDAHVAATGALRMHPFDAADHHRRAGHGGARMGRGRARPRHRAGRGRRRRPHRRDGALVGGTRQGRRRRARGLARAACGA